MVTRTPKTKADLTATAQALAQQYKLVRHNSQLFVPVDWRNPVVTDQPIDPLDTVWQSMNSEEVQRFGNDMGQILFTTPSEATNFHFMLMQEAERPHKLRTDQLFVKTESGLKVLAPDGTLTDSTGEFLPNILVPQLNQDAAIKAELWQILVDWVRGEDIAHSLLHHLATMLAPAWSATKLVMLIGEGANGKSTLLKMLVALLGKHNVSGITRQQMAAREPSIVDLNNKLANIVFDAPKEYLKDSSTEKTLVVGEPIDVRMLYANTNTPVWTNGLFIEGLNQEPKSGDKSAALQRRLVRFQFPNKYALDYEFEAKLTSEPYLGALLALMLDHYVLPNERATKLAPVQASLDLQIEQLWTNSKAFQWLHEIVEKNPTQAGLLVGSELDPTVQSFHAWLMSGKDEYSAVDALRMLKEIFTIDKKSKRLAVGVRKVWTIIGLTPDAQRMVDMINDTEEVEDGVPEADAVVGE